MSAANIDLVRGLYAALARRDLAAFAAGLAPDALISQSDEVPWGGIYHGPDGVLELLAKLAQHVIPEPSISDWLDAGDQVVAIGRTRGVARASGKAYDAAIAHVWQVRDGRVVAVRFCIDHPPVLRALDRG